MEAATETQTSLAPNDPPKPNNMTPVPPKFNAELELVRVEGKVRKIELLSAAGGKTKVRLHLIATVQMGMPKTIQKAADLLWKAAGSIEGKNTTHLTIGRLWAVQMYRFEVAKSTRIKNAPTWECEVVGSPKLSIVGQKEIALSWSVELRAGITDLKTLNAMLEAQDFELTTQELQTQIH